MNSDLAQYKDLFLQTAQEYTLALENALQKLHENPTDKQAIDAIHLSAHSLKSQNNALGFTTTAQVFMGIEHMFKNIQETPSPVPSDLLDLIKSAVDEFRQSLEKIKNENVEDDLSHILEKIQERQTQS